MGHGIAIVGLSCRFAGAAGPAAFWRMLCDGGRAPRHPLRPGREPDTDVGPPLPPACLLSREPLDADFFSVSADEAARMPDAHRLALELAVEALEDAGVPLDGARGTGTGVIVGAMWPSVADRPSADAAPYGLTASLMSAVAGQIAYHLDLHGPALVVDTATSSALTAVHLAARCLTAGDAPIALAGGVNLVDRATSTLLWRLGVLAASDIRPFDEAAEGYIRGEGGGFVVLKPLARAVRDGDRIYAVIRGSAVNHAGGRRPLVAPSTDAQIDLLRSAYRRSRVSPASVTYVETHGTGTVQGDQCEAQALGAVCGEHRHDVVPLLIGSVKANVGHLEAAAGIAGIVKTALALRYRYLPASQNCALPNPTIPFDRLRLDVHTRPSAWPRAASRLAGVTSLGLCGTNCHVVLEGRGRGRAVRSGHRGAGMHLLLLSGRTPRALALRARAFLEWCESRPEVPLRDVCFTAAVRHAHYRYRLGVVCTSLADCATRLADTLAHLPEPSPTRPALVFAFAGGSHGDRRRYRQLVHRFPEMRRSVTTPQYSAGAALNRTDLASDTAIAAWFCRLGLVPDAVMVDAAEALSAREIAEMIHGPVPATVRHSVPVAVDERALNQICGTERVVLRFGDSPASGASSARGSADLTVLSPSDVLNVLGELYTLGFDPMWPKVLPRGSVVSLPVHTWDRAAATSGRATVPDLPDRDAGAVAFDRWVRQQLCEILARPADSFPGTGSLLSLGLDSLAALDLEERLHGAFGIEMRLLRELDDFTLDALVERLIGSCARLDLAPLAVASAD